MENPFESASLFEIDDEASKVEAGTAVEEPNASKAGNAALNPSALPNVENCGSSNGFESNPQNPK